MADKKISQLTSATTLVGTEVMPIVQAGATVKAPLSDIIIASAGYTPDGTGAVARSVASKLQESVSVKDFGAVGDGVTDDTAAIQACANSLVSGQRMVFPATSSRYVFGTVTITQTHIQIRGDGILDGTLKFQQPSASQEMYFDVEGITFHQVGANTKNYIVLGNLFYGRITNCTFKEGNSCVYVPVNTLNTAFQNVGRVLISNNNYQAVNWFVLADITNANYSYTVADLTLIGNSGLCYYDHVSLNTVDGLTCSDNTFFFPYEAPFTSPPMTTKSACVTITTGAHVWISGNKCFESGLSSIALQDVIYFNVIGNEHANAGERLKSAAISVNYTSVPVSNMGVIANEVINESSGPGVQLSNNCRAISVQGCTFFNAGSNSKAYYASPTPDLRAVSIQAASGNVDCVVSNNVSTYSEFDVPDGNGIQLRDNAQRTVGNVTSYFNAPSVIDYTGGASVTVPVDSADIVTFSTPFNATVVAATYSVTNGRYKTVQFMNVSAVALVLVHSASLVLKGATNATVPVNGVVTLLVSQGGIARELSRSF